MVFELNNYLTCDIPEDWCIDYGEDSDVIYDPNGVGAITLSFFNMLDEKSSIQEHICIMAKHFIDSNRIILDSPLSLACRETNYILSGKGKMSSGWFIKLWFVAKYPKIVMATYMTEEEKTDEISNCDRILNSFIFNTGDGLA